MATAQELGGGALNDGRVEAPQKTLLAADGTPLKRKLAQAMLVSQVRAFLLVAPLLLFLMMSFIIPIIQFLSQGAYNDTFERSMPQTTAWLQQWDDETPPGDAAFAALAADLKSARENQTIGNVATRVNREHSGARSTFTSSGRRLERVGEIETKAAFEDAVGARGARDWNDLDLWRAMKVTSQSLTPGFYANAVDMRYTAEGSFEAQPEREQIYLLLFGRTLWISAAVMGLCLLLGYPVAYLLATLPTRTSNLLLILVLLPFWTSLLVRTTAWIALLQGQGVLNDLAVWSGITSDDNRFSMIYNWIGTLVAMTHILLPFMILPIYSVMRTIPPSYVRAAKSLGATNWTAFWRVYAPNTLAGVGAGGLLVFILSIGYYITPALVGGQDGQLISNFIAYHMQKSLNWSLAAALGGLLLAGVLILFWIYDRLIGVDKMKLG